LESSGSSRVVAKQRLGDDRAEVEMGEVSVKRSGQGSTYQQASLQNVGRIPFAALMVTTTPAQ